MDIKTQKKPILFSGIQPSGILTLGNYIGALKNWEGLQDKYACLFSLVDLHTITVRQDPKQFQNQCYDTLALYLASGLDPKKSIIFLQSHVPEHTELCWVLNCYTYLGELNRMTQFKDKIKQHQDNINAGLFSYPALMAADILLYQTSLVPVGNDQKQHVEITRDIALRFNNIYGDIFTIPEVYHPPLGARIMSLQNPIKKMSKSDSDAGATIFLLDTPEIITKKLKQAVTDSGNEIFFDIQDKPGVANLLTVLAVITGKSIEKWVAELQEQGYGRLKSMVAENLINYLRPLQDNFFRIRKDHNYLSQVLKLGAERAVCIAQPMMRRVYEVLGFIPKE